MTYLSPLLGKAGAVAAFDIDSGVAAHYGNPLLEQKQLLLGESVVDLSHLGVLQITGQERRRWLSSLTSQSLENLQTSTGSQTLFLDTKGHVQYAPNVYDDGEKIWLFVEAAEKTPLLLWLDSMRFMLDVAVVDVTQTWALLGGFQDFVPNSEIVWHDPWSKILPGGASYTKISAQQHPGVLWGWKLFLIPRVSLPKVELSLAGTWAYEALRIAAWHVRVGRETDERTLPHELDWLRTAVHLNKGCYRGQETVAKVHNLGYPPRRLVFLHLDGSQHGFPDLGSVLCLPDGEAVGVLTSMMLHYEMGPVGLGLVKRKTSPTSVLKVADKITETFYDAAQEVIVSPDAGKHAKSLLNFQHKKLL